MNYEKEDYKNALIRICQDKVNADDVRMLESLIEENELLKRENKALQDDNFQKCLLNEELVEKNKSLEYEITGLKSTNRRMGKQLDKYYNASMGRR